MADRAIELRGVKKQYPRFTLGEVDLEVYEGKVLGLVGLNGAGKSTLLRILVGLVQPDAGTVCVMGHLLPGDQRAAKAVTSFVSGDAALYAGQTLRWHMKLVRNLCPRWSEQAAEELVERLTLNPDARVDDLSAGQKAKALLLLALARRPEVLILDEPTATLDPIARYELLEFLLETKHQRKALVFSSHYGNDVARIADEIAFLQAGRILTVAPAVQLLAAGESLDEVFRHYTSTGGRAAA